MARLPDHNDGENKRIYMGSRFVKRSVPVSDNTAQIELVLQEGWLWSKGDSTIWKDVPTVERRN